MPVNHSSVRRIGRGIMLRSPGNPSARPDYQRYDAHDDFIARVTEVWPARLQGVEVTAGPVSDGWHMVVQIVSIDGRDVTLLVCRTGWVALGSVEASSEAVRKTSPPTRTYTTASPPAPRRIRLSPMDRKRIVAGVLEHFMGRTGF